MAKHTRKKSRPHESNVRPGSSTADAKAIGGKGDFGVPEGKVAERTYTSINTKRSDPGAAPARAGSDDSRTSGVGGNRSGVGSSSGGDLDTDIIGVGTGSGVAASGKVHEPPGRDDAQAMDGGADPKSARRQSERRVTKREILHGSTVQPADDRTIAPQGADAVSHPEADDDAFAGEISSSEATGRDEAGD